MTLQFSLLHPFAALPILGCPFPDNFPAPTFPSAPYMWLQLKAQTFSPSSLYTLDIQEMTIMICVVVVVINYLLGIRNFTHYLI